MSRYRNHAAALAHRTGERESERGAGRSWHEHISTFLCPRIRLLFFLAVGVALRKTHSIIFHKVTPGPRQISKLGVREEEEGSDAGNPVFLRERRKTARTNCNSNTLILFWRQYQPILADPENKHALARFCYDLTDDDVIKPYLVINSNSRGIERLVGGNINSVTFRS